VRHDQGANITDDPHTLLRPGDEGTVVRHHENIHTVDINWDNGSRLSMCLDAGDHIRLLPADADTGTGTGTGTNDRAGEGVR